ncbi:hypothetical protein UAW_01536 [Enterococcus haemoperoxidus ATCC BAA-382]|uniref:Uncharacterized protein n=1 Tax=Enterococcus haemoperoxidus ATCC BAA-382 TaxID=1158608 RepID=R2SSZ8_9ENTE|nr:SIR2 family protein [Enterococcus haemoperoxidus]EOH98355.1 hypothetical protein UAW_01536 [Enterococcus haemoperoxidus ATCC BAA-382]EOT59868.1 hypothetical protein I583_02503 [Enterococcus haemoperoxidus ATCC BAA-382]OJG56050.1 hypothetical protein RV06_GL000166 [Enterococcus haemoperoxidus]
MKIVKPNEIKDELIESFKRKMLIPIIGSGFSRDCLTRSGKVPSGEDYKKFMTNELLNTSLFSESDQKMIKEKKFSELSSTYNKHIEFGKRNKYLTDNFMHVHLCDAKKKFLEISWTYIYTLNIDDAIERNSSYKNVVHSNRKFNDNIFTQEKCVIKMHGDINEIVTYKDSNSQIFSQDQYLESLDKNHPLLQKLLHDFTFQNLIYIGCSLSDEIDLKTVSIKKENYENVNRYLCTTHEPSLLEKDHFESFGISHIILFDKFDDIYDFLYETWKESEKIKVDELESFVISSRPERIDYKFENNRDYLLFGKGLLDKNRKIYIPYYFISRDLSEKILLDITSNCIQLVFGSRASGKTYLMIDIATKVLNKKVYLFESKDSINTEAFSVLISKKDSLLLFDDGALSTTQLEQLFNAKNEIHAINSHVIIFSNRNSRDLLGLINQLKLKDKLKKTDICEYNLNKKMSKSELDKINKLLPATELTIFKNTTILDNILRISNLLKNQNKYTHKNASLEDKFQVAVLVALATEKKLYSTKIIMLDLLTEIEKQASFTTPLIDKENTWNFEKTYGNNSPTKYVLNAEYWLYNVLRDFVKKDSNRNIIVESYVYIITQLLQQMNGKEISNTANSIYKEYILFDNINKVFGFDEKIRDISLIRDIYDGLAELLSTEPSYMHQKSKCYIKSMIVESKLNKEIRLDYLKKATRCVNTAYQMFESIYTNTRNSKVKISLDHVHYTKAIILCHECYLNNYKNVEENENTLKILYEALSSNNNSYDYARKDFINENDVIKKLISYLLINGNELGISKDAKSYLSSLASIIKNK